MRQWPDPLSLGVGGNGFHGDQKGMMEKYSKKPVYNADAKRATEESALWQDGLTSYTGRNPITKTNGAFIQ